MRRETAIDIARTAAKAKPESYYAEPFQPHEWVIDAIMAADRTPDAGDLHEAMREFLLAWQEPISNEQVRPASHRFANAVDRAILALSTISQATDRGGLYENRALHLCAAEGMGMEGSREDE